MRYVALWRGINVGTAKRLAMADLKALLMGLGATDVHTVLNSGNAVFDRASPPDATALRATVSAELGVDAAIILKTAQQWAGIAADPALPQATDPSRLMVAIGADTSALAALQTSAWPADLVARWTPHAGYLWCPEGVLASPAAVACLKGHGDRVTTRNWATVQKLAALAAR